MIDSEVTPARSSLTRINLQNATIISMALLIGTAALLSCGYRHNSARITGRCEKEREKRDDCVLASMLICLNNAENNGTERPGEFCTEFRFYYGLVPTANENFRGGPAAAIGFFCDDHISDECEYD